MTMTPAVSRDEWLEARKELLLAEKAFTKQRDGLSAQRRQLPCVKIDENYLFQSPDGKRSLSDLFGPASQLIVQHFMLGDGWEAGCPACSFWADGYKGFAVHIAQRDAVMVTVSSAPLAQIEAYKARMGWTFDWVSSAGNSFNRDFHVSFSAEEIEAGKVDYNYEMTEFPATEAPGISVFRKEADGAVYHTYSCYARGLDMMNAAYHYIDLLPKGRDEAEFAFPMAWIRRHDEYEA